ncbi:patatin-like phospholipase family protein [uncultured Alistipes sp.]|uniref:patatin-like phospholipase family protein n=1 Tax=uncultured Alistipes sp. TaxID=538949 RepID=UPI001F95BCEE|nr:patatin-like phospholipase family protein [uncultured Alistipes sp.]HJC18031.1 patatin-like phospholipase family protein [Candidatus Alistipes stercorigallinarum]
MEKGVKGTGRRVALALAGGGARGVAHIGAIEELERRGYEIAAVAGTSMGALVGGMYAAGHLEEFKEWMCSLDRYKVFGLVDFTFSAEGLVKGSRVIDAMKELIPDMRIEQMRLPFTAVSADLLTGREVVIERGGLYDAIRASIAIPSVFRPVHRDGMVLTDGGIVNPMPVNRVRREAGDLLVAVDVCAPFAVEGSGAVGGSVPAAGVNAIGAGRAALRKLPSLNYYKLITASTEIMTQHLTRLMCRLYRPDVLVELPADRFGLFEFYRSREIAEAGAAAARQALDRFEASSGAQDAAGAVRDGSVSL